VNFIGSGKEEELMGNRKSKQRSGMVVVMIFMVLILMATVSVSSPGVDRATQTLGWLTEKLKGNPMQRTPEEIRERWRVTRPGIREGERPAGFPASSAGRRIPHQSVARKSGRQKERRRVMKESALKSEGISGAGEQRGLSLQDIVRAEAVSWLKRLLKEGRAVLDALFESDWEKKTGLRWREWGKYGDRDVSAPIMDFISSAPASKKRSPDTSEREEKIISVKKFLYDCPVQQPVAKKRAASRGRLLRGISNLAMSIWDTNRRRSEMEFFGDYSKKNLLGRC
jgi:hypothetical protein